MKKINNIQVLIILVVMLVAVGCGKDAKKEKAIERVNNVEEPPEKKEDIKEEFDIFFKQFGVDSVFQLSRVNFPISYYIVDIEDNKEEYVYSKDDFWYLDFTEDGQAAERAVDAYEPELVKESASKVKYIKKGIDNGIRIEYFFEMNDKGKWNLTEIVDYSN